MYQGERLNSISHLVGAVLSLIGLGALIAVSFQTGSPLLISGFSIFGVALVLLYTMSTLYHSFRIPVVKGLFKLFDHIAIYILIAGTYTPYLLVGIRDGHSWLILFLIWFLALAGILTEIFLSGRTIKVVQIIIYLAMGWMCVIDLESFKSILPKAGYIWLMLGGITYTLGVGFYILDKLNIGKHSHGIWHFFVMVGSLCHFISVIAYLR